MLKVKTEARRGEVGKEPLKGNIVYEDDKIRVRVVEGAIPSVYLDDKRLGNLDIDVTFWGDGVGIRTYCGTVYPDGDRSVRFISEERALAMISDDLVLKRADELKKYKK